MITPDPSPRLAPGRRPGRASRLQKTSLSQGMPSARVCDPGLNTDLLEPAYAAGDGHLGRQPLDAGGAEEPDDPLGVPQDVLGVLRLGDRPAVAEDEDVGANLLAPVSNRLHSPGGLRQR